MKFEIVAGDAAEFGVVLMLDCSRFQWGFPCAIFGLIICGMVKDTPGGILPENTAKIIAGHKR